MQYILDIRKRYEIQKNKEAISLNLTNRRLEKEERQLWALDIENKRRASLNLEIFDSYKAMEDYNDAKETADDKKDFEINIAKKATEVHGGMGFTDLLGLHYWFKRIGLNRQILGSPELVREEAYKAQL